MATRERQRRRFAAARSVEPDAGSTSTLSVENTELREIGGEFYHYSGGIAYNPASPNFGGKYTLTTEDGLVYQIDGMTGDAEQIQDTNGNSLFFSDDGIRSSSGQKIDFERDPQGRIKAVIDPAGKRIEYGYDADGNLASVTDREGNVTRYEYRTDRPHYLEKVVDPLGRDGIKSVYDDQGRLSRLIDAAGHETQLIYDRDNFVYIVSDALDRQTVYEYDARGNVLTEINPAGGRIERTYDTRNNMLTETVFDGINPSGFTTTFTYDSRANKLSETDPSGRVTLFTYDSRSRLLTSTDPLGNTVTNTYDDAGNLLASTGSASGPSSFSYDSQGNLLELVQGASVTKFEYDAAGNLIKQIDPSGRVSTFTYDDNNRQTSESWIVTTPTGPRTLVTRTEYDDEGRITKTIDAEGSETSYEYDAAGKRIAVIDALGRRTRYQYDNRGQLTKTFYPDADDVADNPATWQNNPFTETRYDAAGQVTAEIDEAGHVTSYLYNAAGRRTKTFFPDADDDRNNPATWTNNPYTETVYDQAGRTIAQFDELRNKSQFVYDAAGQLLTTILPDNTASDADNPRLGSTYDVSGRRISSTDPLGRTTHYVYSDLGQLLETILPDATPDDLSDNPRVRTTYNAAGQPAARIDALERTTHFEYDLSRRLTAVVDPLAGRTEYSYDEAGNLVRQKDAENQVTRYEYDGLGRKIATVLPLGQRSTIDYDAVGNVISTADFNGQTIEFEYDPRNRVLEKRYADANNTAFAYRYTVAGQLDQIVDGRGTTRFVYDPRDRLLSRTDPDGRLISYTYDAAGNRLSTTVPSGTTVYTFDALQRISTVTDPQSGLTSYFYDLGGSLVLTQRANGTTEAREYDEQGRLIEIENRGPGDVLLDRLDYTLDDAGNRTRIAELSGRTVDYVYDDLDRLTQEVIQDASLGNRAIAYTYDKTGNRLTRSDSVAGLTTYDYDDNDRLLSETTAGLATSYTYDGNGNTLSKTTSATDRAIYEWDFENRLVAAEVTSAGVTKQLEYKYDANGMRVEQSVDGVKTRYLLDTVQPYAQVIEEYTPGGVIQVSYVHGNDLISQNRGGTRSFYLPDGLGSTRALTSEAGAITDRYVYDAFGRVLQQTGSTANQYLFAGEQRDHNLGLDYLRARYYDFSTGRFASYDTFPGSIRDPLTLHRYTYGLNNAVNRIDPSGQFSVGVAAVGAIVGVLATLSVGGYYFHTPLRVTIDSKVAILYARSWAEQMANGVFESNYAAWFDSANTPPDQQFVEVVRLNWQRIADATAGAISIKFDPKTQSYAYVYKGGAVEIFLGKLFDDAQLANGWDNKVGIIIHELSHEVAGTIDITYGRGNARALASHPARAVTNADNYEYQGEDIFA